MSDSTEDNARKMQLINDLMHATIMRERERCAKIADDYAEEHRRGSSVTSVVEDAWGVAHGKAIAKLIRGEK